jgi:hypothetical protein
MFRVILRPSVKLSNDSTETIKRKNPFKTIIITTRETKIAKYQFRLEKT